MTCPKCGREFQNEFQNGKCAFCATPLLIQKQPEKPGESRMSIASKSLGICPDCGTEQTGIIYKISSVLAEFLKPKHENVFVPDKHQCGKKSATG